MASAWPATHRRSLQGLNPPFKPNHIATHAPLPTSHLHTYHSSIGCAGSISSTISQNASQAWHCCNRNLMERSWQQCIFQQLRVDLRSTPSCSQRAPINPSGNRKLTAKIVFGVLSVYTGEWPTPRPTPLGLHFRCADVLVPLRGSYRRKPHNYLLHMIRVQQLRH